MQQNCRDLYVGTDSKFITEKMRSDFKRVHVMDRGRWTKELAGSNVSMHKVIKYDLPKTQENYP